MRTVSKLFFLLVFAVSAVSCVSSVVEPPIWVTKIELDRSTLFLDVSYAQTLQVVLYPADASKKTLKWESSNPTVATVAEGLVTGKSVGTATITVMSYNGQTAECSVTVGYGVDLGLSVKWATCNIGATKPEEYGRYFAWGDVTGQTWNGSSWSGRGFSKYPSYALDSNNNLKPEYDAAHVNLGGTWRMPTMAEFKELIDNCTRTWTGNYNSTGVAGRIFTSKKTGYTDKSIFLPAAGDGYNSSLYYAGSNGRYWSGSFDSGRNAWNLYFYSDYVFSSSYYRDYGRSVRPVTE